MAEILLARIQHGAGPLRMVGAVGVFLALQADADMLRILLSKFANDILLAAYALEIAAVDLYTWFVGIHLHEDAGLGAVERCANLCVVTLGVQAPVMVVAMSILNLIIF